MGIVWMGIDVYTKGVFAIVQKGTRKLVKQKWRTKSIKCITWDVWLS